MKLSSSNKRCWGIIHIPGEVPVLHHELQIAWEICNTEDQESTCIYFYPRRTKQSSLLLPIPDEIPIFVSMRVHQQKYKLLSSTTKQRNVGDEADATCLHTTKLPLQISEKWAQKKHGSISLHSVLPRDTFLHRPPSEIMFCTYNMSSGNTLFNK